MKTIILVLALSMLNFTLLAGEVVRLDKSSIVAKAQGAAQTEMQKRPALTFSFHQMIYSVDSNYNGTITVYFRSDRKEKTTQHESSTRTVASYESVTVKMNEDLNITDISSTTGGATIRVKTK